MIVSTNATQIARRAALDITDFIWTCLRPVWLRQTQRDPWLGIPRSLECPTTNLEGLMCVSRIVRSGENEGKIGRHLRPETQLFKCNYCEPSKMVNRHRYDAVPKGPFHKIGKRNPEGGVQGINRAPISRE